MFVDRVQLMIEWNNFYIGILRKQLEEENLRKQLIKHSNDFDRSALDLNDIHDRFLGQRECH